MVKNLKEFNDFGVEVIIKYKNNSIRQNVNIIEETLTRMGICNRKRKILIPSCYLFYTRKGYKICHFKELLVMDGFENQLTENDYDRRDSIATLLELWGLLEIKNRKIFRKDPVKIYTLKTEDKQDYEICHKYDFK